MANVVDAAATDAGFYSKKKATGSAFPNVANDFLQTQAAKDDPQRSQLLAAHKADLQAIQERFAQVQRQFGNRDGSAEQSKWSRLRPAASGEAELTKVASSTINAQDIISRNKFSSADAAVCMLAFRLNLAHLLSKKKDDLQQLVLKHTFMPDLTDTLNPTSPKKGGDDVNVKASLDTVDRITGLYQELESARAREKEQAESRRTVVKPKLKPLSTTTMVDSSDGNENAGPSQAQLLLALKNLPTLRVCLMHHHENVGAVLLEHGVADKFGLSIRSKEAGEKEKQRLDKLEQELAKARRELAAQRKQSVSSKGAGDNTAKVAADALAKAKKDMGALTVDMSKQSKAREKAERELAEVREALAEALDKARAATQAEVVVPQTDATLKAAAEKAAKEAEKAKEEAEMLRKEVDRKKDAIEMSEARWQKEGDAMRDLRAKSEERLKKKIKVEGVASVVEHKLPPCSTS
jgi:hypothetical protein